MDGEDQPAASQISEMDTPLDHAQEEAIPLMEWALTPKVHCKPKEEYARVILSTNHLEIPCQFLAKFLPDSGVDENALLMSEVRGEWADWLEMIERQQ